MDTQNTIEKMKQLRLFAMADMYYKSMTENLYRNYTIDEFVALLIDSQWDETQNIKINNITKSAKLKTHPTISSIDYNSMRNLDKNMFERLLSLNFIKQSDNIIITGASGVGKSYLAQVIVNTACRNQIKTLYYNANKLQEDIKLAKIEGNYINFLKSIQRSSLLIIDDFGLQPFDNITRQGFFDIIEERYNSVSTIITSQLPIKSWHGAIGEGTIADAILDRVFYSSHKIELNGDSLRKNKKLI